MYTFVELIRCYYIMSMLILPKPMNCSMCWSCRDSVYTFHTSYILILTLMSSLVISIVLFHSLLSSVYTYCLLIVTIIDLFSSLGNFKFSRLHSSSLEPCKNCTKVLRELLSNFLSDLSNICSYLCCYYYCLIILSVMSMRYDLK